MNNEPTPELFWLVATTTMTALFWIPYILNRMTEQGVLNAFRDPDGLTDTKVAWADRMMSAHNNAVENLAIFAPLVLVLHATEISTDATSAACMIYFFARAAHFLVFSFRLPFLRVISFVTGFGAQLVLALTLLGKL